MKMTLKVDQIEVELGSSCQAQIADCLPDRAEYSDLFHALAPSPNSDTRSAIAYKEHLSKATVWALLVDKEPEVLERILNHRLIKESVTTDELKQVIERGGADVAKSVATSISEFENVDANEIIQVLCDLNDPAVLLSLVETWGVSRKVLKKFSTWEDPDIAAAALGNLNA